MSRCYILGSGFSRICGLPLASELTPQVFEHAYAEDEDFKDEARMAYRSMLRNLYPGYDFKTSWPDFEELITVLDEWELYRQDYEGINITKQVFNPSHLKSILMRHLPQILCEKTTSCPRDKKDIVTQFVKHVVQSGDSIISFNWDLLLEVNCLEARIPVKYDNSSSDALILIKPHGSLNLVELPRSDYEEAKESFNVHSLTEIYAENDWVVLQSNDPRESLARILIPFGIGLLVEPSTRKSYQSIWIQVQWRRALNILKAVNEIVIIGYSLPRTDFRPRILLQLAMLNRESPPSLQIIDPEAKQLIEHYRQYILTGISTSDTSWDAWFRKSS